MNGLVQHQSGKSCHARQELRLSAKQSPTWQPVEWEGGYCHRPESAVTPLWVGEGLLCSGLGEPLLELSQRLVARAQKPWQGLPRSSVYKPIGTRDAHNCEMPEDAVLSNSLVILKLGVWCITLVLALRKQRQTGLQSES